MSKEEPTGKNNPRWANRSLRIKYRERFKAMNAPCAICGRPIDYSIPRNPKEPFSMVIDEIIPISKAIQYGYNSEREAAEDFNNLQACHRICNQMKGNKINYKPLKNAKNHKIYNKSDGNW